MSTHTLSWFHQNGRIATLTNIPHLAVRVHSLSQPCVVDLVHCLANACSLCELFGEPLRRVLDPVYDVSAAHDYVSCRGHHAPKGAPEYPDTDYPKDGAGMAQSGQLACV